VAHAWIIGLLAAAAGSAADRFTDYVKPVLQANCGACHDPKNPNNRIDFLKAQTAADIEQKRGLWRNVATQLRHRTMPPVASKITEADRMEISRWVETRLRETACSSGPFAGYVAPRRLNRREYKNTVRDLLGVDVDVTELFPADEAGGAGFDTNGETLYIPPMMLERYLEAAAKVVDRVVVTPLLSRHVQSAHMAPARASDKPGRPLEAGEKLTTTLPVYVDGKYSIRVSIERPRDHPVDMNLQVDGSPALNLIYARDSAGGPTARGPVVELTRGMHTFTVSAGQNPVSFYRLMVDQTGDAAPAAKRLAHYRLFGIEAEESPLHPERSARRTLERLLPRAFRHPVEAGEVERYMALYKRSAERGDPHEEAVKQALKAVLVSPRFLFRWEQQPAGNGIEPLAGYDLASRLSYFLWGTMPDEELMDRARSGKLQEAGVLAQQVERMLDDPRSRAFADAFVGQWLGTKEVGGRVVPLLTELQHYYTPEAAAELRQEPVLLFQHLLAENRSVLELLTANYSFLTERLAKFYQVDDQVEVKGDSFRKVAWPDDRRAGVLGMAGVLAMTSHYRQSSPVLRGAWVLDTLLGTPVPPPPPDVPPLEKATKNEKGLTMRQILARHREDASCATCHSVMDPLGFGLENFDWMGRWRDTESNGAPVDATGVMPSGEKFEGPAGLRQVLLGRKEDFVRHVVGKVLGFALGRSLQDGDSCTVQRIADALEKDGYRARTLVREVAWSVPFRNTQGGLEMSPAEPAKPAGRKDPKRLLGDK
jgi:mono/diheme cytochrome c family protein